jgi:hypothetical protein
MTTHDGARASVEAWTRLEGDHGIDLVKEDAR